MAQKPDLCKSSEYAICDSVFITMYMSEICRYIAAVYTVALAPHVRNLLFLLVCFISIFIPKNLVIIARSYISSLQKCTNQRCNFLKNMEMNFCRFAHMFLHVQYPVIFQRIIFVSFFLYLIFFLVVSICPVLLW